MNALRKYSKWLLLIVSVLGLAVSGYLVYYHYAARAGVESFCNVNSVVNCSKVILSKYSEVAGIPVGVLGGLWFAVMLLLGWGPSRIAARLGDQAPFIAFVWGLVGLAGVAWFVFVEAALLKSLCLLCTTAHVLIVASFPLTYLNLKRSLGEHFRDLFTSAE